MKPFVVDSNLPELYKYKKYLHNAHVCLIHILMAVRHTGISMNDILHKVTEFCKFILRIDSNSVHTNPGFRKTQVFENAQRAVLGFGFL